MCHVYEILFLPDTWWAKVESAAGVVITYDNGNGLCFLGVQLYHTDLGPLAWFGSLRDNQPTSEPHQKTNTNPPPTNSPNFSWEM